MACPWADLSEDVQKVLPVGYLSLVGLVHPCQEAYPSGPSLAAFLEAFPEAASQADLDQEALYLVAHALASFL